MANERVKEGRVSLTLLYDKNDFRSKEEKAILQRQSEDLSQEIRAKVNEIVAKYEGFRLIGGTYKVRAIKSECNCGAPECLTISKEEHESRMNMYRESMREFNRLFDLQKASKKGKE